MSGAVLQSGGAVCLDFSPVSERAHLEIWHSCLTNPRGTHHRYLEKHHFIHQIEICLPNPVKTKISTFEQQMFSNKFYYQATVSLSQLLTQDFLNEYIRNQGNFHAISTKTPIDHCNVIAIYNGKLMLCIDRETYVELGISSNVQHSVLVQNRGKKNHRRYNIIIDLCKKDFKQGNKTYDRLLWAISSKRINPIEFLFTYSINDCCKEIRLPSGINLTKHDVKSEYSLFNSLSIPQAIPHIISGTFMNNVNINENEDNISETNPSNNRSSILVQLYEYLGLLSIRANEYLSSLIVKASQTPPPIKPFYTFSDLRFLSCPVHFIRTKGLFSSDSKYISIVKEYINKHNLPWAIINFWGFNDSPVSWDSHEHDFDFSGDNNCSVIILPNGEYMLFVAVGAEDQT